MKDNIIITKSRKKTIGLGWKVYPQCCIVDIHLHVQSIICTGTCTCIYHDKDQDAEKDKAKLNPKAVLFQKNG